MTNARIATQSFPDLQVESPSTLLSAAEHVLKEVSLGLFRECASLRQQEYAIRSAAYEKRRKEGTFAIGDLTNTKHLPELNGQGGVQIPDVRTQAKRFQESFTAALQLKYLRCKSATLTKPFVYPRALSRHFRVLLHGAFKCILPYQPPSSEI
jgi:hypothetical protein